ncbi:peptide chain release factor 3 (BRF-3) [Mycobacteroides abscessus subsp. abscessus]|nr:peptide chain release factor 3 (BRF-3) [Mycobacteroides abscessus subsp. abscessus]
MDVTLQRTNKKQKITRSTSFMADDKETVNHAVAGDIIGLYDTGNYQIGDTLVGGKQFEVFEHRMNNEYNVDVVMEPVGRKIARWIENEEDIKDNMNTSRSILVKDRYDNYVFLFENEFATRWFEEKFSDIKLYSLL